MEFWIINFVFFSVYSIILKLFRKDNVFLLVACVHMGIIMAFRSVNVGTDTKNYAYAYNILKSTGHMIENHVASNSKVFLWILKMFSFLPLTQGYMISTTILIMSSFFLFIKKLSYNYYASVFLFWTTYLMFYSMNATRHWIAISLVFLCFILVEERKMILSIIIFIVASLIHNAVSIFLIYYFIILIRWNIKKLSLFVLFSFWGMNFVLYLIDIFIFLFPHYSWLRTKIFAAQYISGGKTSLIYAVCSGIVIVLNFLFLLKRERIFTIKIGSRDIIDSDLRFKENIQNVYRTTCLMILAYAMFSVYSSSILISRIAYVFFGFILVELPNTFFILEKKIKSILSILYFLLIIFMFMQLKGNYSGVLNYTFLQYTN